MCMCVCVGRGISGQEANNPWQPSACIVEFSLSRLLFFRRRKTHKNISTHRREVQTVSSSPPSPPLHPVAKGYFFLLTRYDDHHTHIGVYRTDGLMCVSLSVVCAYGHVVTRNGFACVCAANIYTHMATGEPHKVCRDTKQRQQQHTQGIDVSSIDRAGSAVLIETHQQRAGKRVGQSQIVTVKSAHTSVRVHIARRSATIRFSLSGFGVAQCVRVWGDIFLVRKIDTKPAGVCCVSGERALKATRCTVRERVFHTILVNKVAKKCD